MLQLFRNVSKYRWFAVEKAYLNSGPADFGCVRCSKCDGSSLAALIVFIQKLRNFAAATLTVCSKDLFYQTPYLGMAHVSSKNVVPSTKLREESSDDVLILYTKVKKTKAVITDDAKFIPLPEVPPLPPPLPLSPPPKPATPPSPTVESPSPSVLASSFSNASSTKDFSNDCDFFMIDTRPSKIRIQLDKPVKSKVDKYKCKENIPLKASVSPSCISKHLVSSINATRNHYQSKKFTEPKPKAVRRGNDVEIEEEIICLEHKEKVGSLANSCSSINATLSPTVNQQVTSNNNTFSQVYTPPVISESTWHTWAAKAATKRKRDQRDSTTEVKTDVQPVTPKFITLDCDSDDDEIIELVTDISRCSKKSPDILLQSVDVPDVVELKCSQDSVNKPTATTRNVSEDESDSVPRPSDTKVQNMDVVDTEYIPIEVPTVSQLEDDELYISDETLAQRDKLDCIRKWELTGYGRELEKGLNGPGVAFTLLSYNVLSQALLTDNMNLYSDCQDEHLTWDYRWALIQHEVRKLSPDVLTLQEIEAVHYHSHYLPWFTHLGYGGVYKKRTGNKTDGCAIFYNKRKFNLAESVSVEYRQPHGGPILDRENIAIIAKISSVNDPTLTFCVATTHLLYNPRRHDVKLAQLVLLLTELDRLSYEGMSADGQQTQCCPVILTGDFNAVPHASVLKFLKDGQLIYEGLNSKTLTRYGNYSGYYFGKEFLPPELGISNYCQHEILNQSRYVDCMVHLDLPVQDKRRMEERLISLYHSERAGKPPSDLGFQKASSRQSTGSLHHGFNLQSVYEHKLRRLRGEPEVTTNQDSWVTVDYIMYSKTQSNTSHLKLVARYGLLSGPEAVRFSPLPSAVCPSDHFPLAAKFTLQHLR